MVFAQTDGIVSVLLDHTHTRGPSAARMRDFSSLIIKRRPCYLNMCLLRVHFFEDVQSHKAHLNLEDPLVLNVKHFDKT